MFTNDNAALVYSELAYLVQLQPVLETRNVFNLFAGCYYQPTLYIKTLIAIVRINYLALEGTMKRDQIKF